VRRILSIFILQGDGAMLVGEGVRRR